jgi:hypothetical protein
MPCNSTRATAKQAAWRGHHSWCGLRVGRHPGLCWAVVWVLGGRLGLGWLSVACVLGGCLWLGLVSVSWAVVCVLGDCLCLGRLSVSWTVVCVLGGCLRLGWLSELKAQIDERERDLPPALTWSSWPCGLMDKALVFGTKDCRFESCQGHVFDIA